MTVRGSRLARGLGAMLLGGAAGQVVALALSPVLTRLYGPADLGLLAVSTALVSLLGTLSTLRLEVAVVLPSDDGEAEAVVRAATVCILGVSLVVGVAGPVVARPLADLLGVPSLAPLWWLVTLTGAGVGFFQLFSSWMVRQQRYTALGLRNVLLGGTTTGGQVGLGLAGVGAVGLLAGQALGYAAAVVGLGGLRGPARAGARTGLRTGRATAVAALRRYRRFPLVASWSSVINTAGQQAPLLVVSAAYGQVVIGLLGLTLRVLAAPVALVGRAVAQVFLGEAGAGSRVGDAALADRLRRTALALLALGALPALLLVAAGPELFRGVFGPPWLEAGTYARLLAAGYLAQFAVSPISQTLLVLERQAAQLAWDSARLLFTCGAPLLVALAGGPPVLAVGVLSAAFVVSYLALYLTCARAAAGADRALLSEPA